MQGAGLAVGHGVKFWRLSSAQGLQENVVSWFHRVGDRIWWTDNRGMDRASRSEFVSVARAGQGRLTPPRLTTGDGMPADETNGIELQTCARVGPIRAITSSAWQVAS